MYVSIYACMDVNIKGHNDNIVVLLTTNLKYCLAI